MKVTIKRTREAGTVPVWTTGARPKAVPAGYTVFADGVEVATIGRSYCWEVWFKVEGKLQKRNFSKLAAAKAWATGRFGA